MYWFLVAYFALVIALFLIEFRRRLTMPLTKKGDKIKRAMDKEYGNKKGTKVFYASKNKGTIKGVEKGKRRKK